MKITRTIPLDDIDGYTLDQVIDYFEKLKKKYTGYEDVRVDLEANISWDSPELVFNLRYVEEETLKEKKARKQENERAKTLKEEWELREFNRLKAKFEMKD